jgi:hypothetical protein
VLAARKPADCLLGGAPQEIDLDGQLQPLKGMVGDDLLVWVGEGITKVVVPATAKPVYEALRGDLLGKKRKQKTALEGLLIEGWEKVQPSV